MDQEKLTDLIKRYKSGSATPEEIARLEKIWRDANRDTSFRDDHTSAELQEIEQNMFRAIKLEIVKHERSVRTPLLINPLFYKAAALLVILMSVTLWWYASANSPIEIQTGFGERLTVTLPDKSTVELNGNSVLRYSNDWDEKSTREVWIEGEGFFSVTHTKDNQKFLVHASSQLNVEVLGTKFNVKARNSRSEVMLAEGKVKLDLAKDLTAEAVILKPGELAIMQNQRLSKRMVKQRKYTSWVENKLFFERTPLSELAVLLRDTYGLKVIFNDPNLETRELSGEISSANADDVLYAIAETLNLQVKREGQSVTVSLKRN
jgi:ferric-dicitrate binding protein FerR (iron transport regulator)